MDLQKKKKNCAYCLNMRCCLDHCCNWDRCQCRDCILCGGTQENDYTSEEKAKLFALFREADKKQEKLQAKPEDFRENHEKIAAKVKENSEIAKKSNETPEKHEQIVKTQADSNAEAERVKKLVDETTRKTNETLASIERTLASLKKTQEECRATDQKFQDFQDKFQNVMDGFALKLSEGLGQSGLLGPAHKRPQSDKIYQPTISDIESVAEDLITKTNIVILTGAGISVASGLPTFRGKGGLWTTKNNETISADKFLTYKYFEGSPQEIWDWHFDFKRMVRLSSPNVSHLSIAEIQHFCEENGLECTLITQNIDNYHIESYCKVKSYAFQHSNNEEEFKSSFVSPHLFPQTSASYGFVDGIYEIHGNINYMRCDAQCTKQLFPSPEVPLSSFSQGHLPIPKCPLCKGIARPHTLFFDEGYNEEYYKKDTVMKKIENMDCLIVVGTMLETNLASRIVGEAISSEILIIEINPQPVIECGRVFQLIGESEKIVPDLWKLTRVKFFEYHEKQGKS